MVELVVELLKFMFLLFLLLLIPFALIVATPFVLLWPRQREDELYRRAVFRRYGKVLETTCFITPVGGGAVE